MLESGGADTGGLAHVYPSTPSTRTPARKVAAFCDFLLATLKKDWFE